MAHLPMGPGQGDAAVSGAETPSCSGPSPGRAA
jgi:hypothetical protein